MTSAPAKGLCPLEAPGQAGLGSRTWTTAQPTLSESSALAHFPGPSLLLQADFSIYKSPARLKQKQENLLQVFHIPRLRSPVCNLEQVTEAFCISVPSSVDKLRMKTTWKV